MTNTRLLGELKQALEGLGATVEAPHEGALVATKQVAGAVLRAAFRVVDGTVEALMHAAVPPDPCALQVLVQRLKAQAPWANLAVVGEGERRQLRLSARWPVETLTEGLHRFIGLAIAVAEAAEALRHDVVARAFLELSGL